MFIKLLAISMVASSFLGRSKSFAIIFIAADLFSKPSLISALVKENNATSAPDIRAEQIRSIIRSTLLEISDVLIANTFKTKTVGSGSNIKLN